MLPEVGEPLRDERGCSTPTGGGVSLGGAEAELVVSDLVSARCSGFGNSKEEDKGEKNNAVDRSQRGAEAGERCGEPWELEPAAAERGREVGNSHDRVLQDTG